MVICFFKIPKLNPGKSTTIENNKKTGSQTQNGSSQTGPPLSIQFKYFCSITFKTYLL
jgi:hypothetical protein